MYFHIDITSFLSIEDLTIIFTRWIWTLTLIIIILIYLIYSILEKVGSNNSYWDKTIGKTMFKRRTLFVLPIIILVILSAFIYKEVATYIVLTTSFGAVILLLVSLVFLVFSSFKDKKELTELEYKDWINLIVAAYIFIVFIPFVSGAIVANKMTNSNIQVKFENGTSLNTTDSINQVFIGKTTKYFFTYDTLRKTTTAYNMEKVSSLTIMGTGKVKQEIIKRKIKTSR